MEGIRHVMRRLRREGAPPVSLDVTRQYKYLNRPHRERATVWVKRGSKAPGEVRISVLEVCASDTYDKYQKIILGMGCYKGTLDI